MAISILVTGSKGQLGNEIQVLSSKLTEFEFHFHDVDTLDITNLEALEDSFSTIKPFAVINCAAYTAVDKAESEPEKAFKINADALGNLAHCAEKYNCWVLHVSTDYVFDGTHHIPYRETDYTNPLSVYGKSKLAGEMLLSEIEKAIIVRTSWLYSTFGHNIVKTIRRLATERDTIGFVCDQIGSPTYAADLAGALLIILQRLANTPEATSLAGIYHYANEGACSWYDFACTTVELSKLSCKVKPIETQEYPTPAQRPPYSVLNKSKIKTTFGLEIPWWRNSLEKAIHLMNEAK
ncbi:MAG: dTDP-4-dehydrorhamnose reductase [Bacteroidales bacterium]|nr:dTDP-4-dehydrorhamnose reductase [Bacteroidales bacterium]HPO66107.1 dTDP-4-dehydrorhamnose reductase [Bacteroidales bacterium]